MGEPFGATGRSPTGGPEELVAGEPEGPGGMRKPPGPELRGVVEGVARELRAADMENARGEAERLVSHALGLARHELALEDTGERLDPARAGRLARLVRRRLQGEPLQYIEGTVDFRELTLRCDPRALVPRPETEQLVSRVVRWIREHGKRGEERGGRGGEEGGRCGEGGREGEVPGSRCGPAVDRILDVGTGSGAIALSLLAEGRARHAVGLDVSSEALALAAENTREAGVEPERFELRLVTGGLWTAVGADERFDIVVSNPPYVPEAEMEDLPPEVADREPRAALAGGEDGLEVIREIVARAAGYLRPGGALFLEIGASQGEDVRALLEGSGAWTDVRVQPDLAGRDRFVSAIPANTHPDRSPVA